jgi:hypothetical protein
VAAQPEAHRAFLSAFASRPDDHAGGAGFTVRTPRGAIEITTPEAFRTSLGAEPPDSARGLRIGALRIAVRDPAAAHGVLAASDIRFGGRDGRLTVSADDGMGAALVFEPAHG